MKEINMPNMSGLDGLSKKNQQKVQNLINKLATKQDQQNNSESGESSEESLGESSGGQERNVRRPPMTQVKKIPPTQQSGQQTKKTISQKPNIKKSKRHSGRPDGAPATVQAINTIDDRPNFFLGEGDGQWLKGVANSAKKDVKIDQRLSGDNEPTPRQRQELIEATCNVCHKEHEVSIKLVNIDGSEIRFTCDNCLGRR